MGYRVPKAYLGGPDVFCADAKARGERLKDLCREVGLEGVFPIDNELDLGGLTKREQATRIKHENVRLILSCDLMLANMEPWRGPGMDGGTAWEMGFAEALGLAIFGYTSDQRSYRERVVGARESGDAIVDPEGRTVEDFGNPDNLMMAAWPTPVLGSAQEAVKAAADWWAKRVDETSDSQGAPELRQLVAEFFGLS